MRRIVAGLLLLLTMPALAQGNVPIVPDTAAEIFLLDVWGSGSATGVAFAPNGKLGAVATTAGIHLYETGVLGAPDIIDRRFSANAVAFSPADGSLTAVAIGYNLRTYDAFSGEMLQDTYPPELASPLGEVAYSPDGAHIATNAGADLMVLDAATHAVLFVSTGHIARIRAIHYSADGARILTTSDDLTVNVWDAATGAHLFTVSTESGISDAVFAADSLEIIAASADGSVSAWDAEGVSSPLVSVTDTLTAVAAADGVIALGSADGTVYLVTDGVATLGNQTGAVTALAFTPSGALLASLGAASVTLWDVAESTEIGATVFETSYRALSLDESGAFLTAVGTSGALYAFDTADGTFSEIADAPADDAASMTAVSADGTQTAFSEADGQITVRTPDGDVTLASAVGRINTLAFSPDGQALAAGSSDGYVEIWRIASPDAPVARAENFFGEVSSLAYSPDGTLLAVTSLDATLRVIDAATGELYALRYDHNAPVTGVIFSPDGTRIYSAADNGTIIAWGILE